MADIELHPIAIFQEHDDGLFVARALFYPEILLVDSSLPRLRGRLRDAVRHYAESKPALSLHQRQHHGTPLLDEVVFRLAPSGKSVGWEEPLELRFPVLRWKHGEDAYIAYVPDLEIEVSAPREPELLKLLPEHIRFALMRRKAANSLLELALLQREPEVSLDPLILSVQIQSPKQREVAEEAEADGKANLKRVIDEAGVDLTASAAAIPRAYEMETLVADLADALAGRGARSVLLVGASGVGKTALFHELARRRADFKLGATPFWETTGSRLIAGMSGFGKWQERCQRLVREASKQRAVLHLGNIIELMQVGRGGWSSQGMAGFLRPHIARGEVLAVAECTPEQLPVIEREDPHLLQVFHVLKVQEPNADSGRMILLQCALEWSGGRDVLTDGALEIVDRLHRRFATYSAYPGRPLRFLRNLLRDRQAPLPDRKGGAVHVEAMADVAAPVTPTEITDAFARETGLPRFMIDDAHRLNLAEARVWFSQRVIGQGEAVDLVADLLATVKAGLNRPRRPIISMLFIGPTGVGKTEMAKALAEFFFSDRNRMTRFDMSEFNTPAAVQRLVGGVFGAEGLLTAKVREQPFSVLLLDEFEKADAGFFDLLLQVLGEGRLTDAAGRVADFSNAIVVMTSNLGAQSYQRGTFGLTQNSQPDARQHFTEEVRSFLRPELFNRIDRIVPFAPLDEATILNIARRELGFIATRDGVRLRGVELEITEEATRYLAAAGYDVLYGARPLKRAIERELLVPLADGINGYPAGVKLLARANAVGGKLTITVRGKTAEETGANTALGELTAASVAGKSVELRREVQALLRSSALLSLKNEIFSLRRLSQRPEAKSKAKMQPRFNPFDAERAVRLGRLEPVHAEVESISAQVFAAEDSLLGDFYDSKAIEPILLAVQLRSINAAFDELLQTLYDLRYGKPDSITLAVYGESSVHVMMLAEAYYESIGKLGGSSEVYWYTRYGKDSLCRHHAADARTFFDGSGEGALGIAMAVSLSHAMARLESERGLHEIIDEKNEHPCLVDTSPTALVNYEPPPRIEYHGAIGPGPRGRIYNLQTQTADDGVTRLPYRWHRRMEEAVTAASGERLAKALYAMTHA